MIISFRENYWKIKDKEKISSVDVENMSTYILHDFIQLMIIFLSPSLKLFRFLSL